MDGEFNLVKWDSGESLMNQRVCRVRSASRQLDNDFLRYYLSAILKRVEQQTTCVTVKHLSAKVLNGIAVPATSLTKQIEIADQLGAIQRCIKQNARQVEKLDSLVKSRFVEVFGDGSQYQTCRMNRLIVSIKAGTNIGGNQRILEQDEYAVLKISAVTSGTFCPDEYKVVDDVSSIKMIHPRKGDLLFSRANTSEMVGATAIVDQDYEQLFLPDKLWRLDPADDVNRVFLKHLLSSAKLRAEMSKVATGSSGSMQNISMEKFRALKAFIPPLALQQEFAAFVSQVDKLRFVDLVK